MFAKILNIRWKIPLILNAKSVLPVPSNKRANSMDSLKPNLWFSLSFENKNIGQLTSSISVAANFTNQP